MVVSKLLSRSGFRSGPGPRIAVAELDRRLDVPTDRWSRAVAALVKTMRKAETEVQVADYRASMAVAANSTDLPLGDQRGSFYHVELRRIPPMDRTEEFRMARRYEFMRLRVEDELLQLGMKPEDAKSLAGRASSEVLAASAALLIKKPARRAYFESVVSQLAELRNLYVEGSLHVVLATVNRYRGLGVDAADLIQEGNASLFQAIEGFDWRRDVRFRTYAQYWVQQAVLKQLYNHARTVRIPIWVQKLLGKIKRAQEEGRRAGREPTTAEIGAKLGLTAAKVEWLLGTRRYAQSLDAELVSGEGATMAQMLADDNAVPVPESVPEGDLRRSLDDVLEDLPEREQSILRRRFGLDGRDPETLSEIAVGMGITAERVRQLQNAAMDRLKRPVKLERLKAFVEQV